MSILPTQADARLIAAWFISQTWYQAYVRCKDSTFPNMRRFAIASRARSAVLMDRIVNEEYARVELR